MEDREHGGAQERVGDLVLHEVVLDAAYVAVGLGREQVQLAALLEHLVHGEGRHEVERRAHAPMVFRRVRERDLGRVLGGQALEGVQDALGRARGAGGVDEQRRQLFVGIAWAALERRRLHGVDVGLGSGVDHEGGLAVAAYVLHALLGEGRPHGDGRVAAHPDGDLGRDVLHAGGQRHRYERTPLQRLLPQPGHGASHRSLQLRVARLARPVPVDDGGIRGVLPKSVPQWLKVLVVHG